MKPNGSEQLRLPLGYGRESLREYFSMTAGKPVSLVITDNSSSMLSVRTKGGMLFVRLHRIFLDADGIVIDEIADFIRHRKRKTPHLNRFVRQNRNLLPTRQPRKTEIKTQGRYHDLNEIWHGINNEYFGGRICCPITWGLKSPRYAAKKRTLGSYNCRTNTIRISPLLDRRHVPRYYIEFVVYHEMVHADTEKTEKGKRRSVHSREFRRRERMFRHYDRAVAWEKERF
ncbi:MAG TPA: SprT-like domain-containing protein [Thermodesulfovibrionales bacterium]|nr:SprT-like domain-containing protein [Thermodesulfovibrionales bacterium]